MRKIIILKALLMISQAHLYAQVALPYNTSTVQGSTVITNFTNPYSGINTGPGLNISPLDARFNAPLGVPWSTITPPTPNVTTTVPRLPVTTVGTPAVSTVAAPVVTTPAVPLTTPVTTPPSATSIIPTRPPSTTTIPTPYATPPPVPSVLSTSVPARTAVQPLTVQRPVPLLPAPVTGVGPVVPGYPGEPTYLFPGLVRDYLGQWVGSDYLFDVPTNIGVVVEVITPTDLPFFVDKEAIRQNINEVFANAGINPYSEEAFERPPLPFFHLVVFLLQAGDTFIFSMSGRFFEEVKLVRLNFPLPGTSQAITWEKQELVATSQSRVGEQLLFSAREIADLFVQRVNYFARLKLEQEAELKVRCPPPSGLRCRRKVFSF